MKAGKSIAARILLAVDAFIAVCCILLLVFPIAAPVMVNYAFRGGQSALTFGFALMMLLPITGVALWRSARNMGWRDGRAIMWASLPILWMAGMAISWFAA